MRQFTCSDLTRFRLYKVVLGPCRLSKRLKKIALHTQCIWEREKMMDAARNGEFRHENKAEKNYDEPENGVLIDDY